MGLRKQPWVAGLLPEQFKEPFVAVFVAMGEAKFGLFPVEQKGGVGHAHDLLEAGFSQAAERFDAGAMRGAEDEFIRAVAEAQVAGKADVHQPVVTAPAVGVEPRRPVWFAPNPPLPGLVRAVRDDFRVALPAAFEPAEDEGVTACAPAPFPADATRAEGPFVEFDRAAHLGRHRTPRLPAAQAQLQGLDGTP